MFGLRRDTCRNKLAHVLDKELFSKCLEFMTRIKHSRHSKTPTGQLSKFHRLEHKYNGGFNSYTRTNHHVEVISYTKHSVNTYNSNIHNKKQPCRQQQQQWGQMQWQNKGKWVINMFSTHLMEAQGLLLVRGPNFAKVPKHPLKENM